LRRVLLARVAEPLILIDWPDLRADQAVHLLPVHVPPIIISNSGFKVPFYREVEHLDWR